MVSALTFKPMKNTIFYMFMLALMFAVLWPAPTLALSVDECQTSQSDPPSVDSGVTPAFDVDCVVLEYKELVSFISFNEPLVVEYAEFIPLQSEGKAREIEPTPG